ncbi:MAG: hypothetical protein ACLFTI_08965 [Anaerolineales bacterium]
MENSRPNEISSDAKVLEALRKPDSFAKKEQIMEAIRVREVIAEDGKVTITNLPYKKGETVEVILLSQPTGTVSKPRLTAQKLRQSGLIGMWKDRQDIQDGSAYARQLREQAQKRGDISYDPVG